MVPVTAFNQNAAHIYGNTRAKGFRGTAGQKPSVIRLSIVEPPATIPMPIVCSTSMVGNAQIVGASFTHMLKDRFSRNSRKWCIFLFPELVASAFTPRRVAVHQIADNRDHDGPADYTNNRALNQ